MSAFERIFESMGMNKRYGSDISDAVVVESATRPVPISLGERELGDARVREAREPIPVEAWVRFPEIPVLVHGVAKAWTDRAVLVEWTMRNGQQLRAWVWASAVTREVPKPPQRRR